MFVQFHCVHFLTSREEVVDSPRDVERRQLQTLGQAGKSVALNSGRVVHPPSKQQALDQELVWQEAGELWVQTLFRPPLWLLQQNHHHIHGKQPAHHLHKAAKQTVHTHRYH